MKKLEEIKSPKIDFVGGLMIESVNPKELATWYTEVFGLETTLEHGGAFYGGYTSDSTALHFGITKWKGEGKPIGNMMITFHVDNFSEYLSMLKDRKLDPAHTEEDEEGKFAFYADPEGNRIGIWGK